MRNLLSLFAAASMLFVAVGSANAAPLNWEGTSFVVLGDLSAIESLGGGVATINNSSGSLPAHLQTLRLKGSRGGVADTVTVLVTDPETAGNNIFAIIVEAELGTGTFGGISGAVPTGTSVLTRNQLPIRGVAKICLFNTTCSSFLELLLTVPTTVNGVPGSGVIGLGVGGLITVGGGTMPEISMKGAPWTVKTVTAIDQITTTSGNTTFTMVTAKGFAHAPSSGTTSTAALSGVVQMVTPVQIVTNLSLGSSAKLGGSVSLLIHFIPEPGWLMLLGSGVVGLAFLGSRRMRK